MDIWGGRGTWWWWPRDSASPRVGCAWGRGQCFGVCLSVDALEEAWKCPNRGRIPFFFFFSDSSHQKKSLRDVSGPSTQYLELPVHRVPDHRDWQSPISQTLPQKKPLCISGRQPASSVQLPFPAELASPPPTSFFFFWGFFFLLSLRIHARKSL